MFNTSCTFTNLNLSVVNFTSSSQHTLILSLDNSTVVVAERSTSGMVCLVDSNSSFLKFGPNLLPETTVLPLVIPLTVIPDVTPPAISSVDVDLSQGFIKITFDEFVELTTLDASLLSLSGSNDSASLDDIGITSLINYDAVVLDVTTTFTINLEVFELAIINNICSSVCYLYIGIGTLVIDTSGNVYGIQDFTFIPTTLINYSPSQFIPSFNTQIVGLTRSDVLISPASSQIGNVLNYRIYVFAESADFYHGNCEYPIAYTFQKGTIETRWAVSNALPSCVNATDYMCYSTTPDNLNLTVDIFPGYITRISVVSSYTLIDFTSTTRITPITAYGNYLNLQITTDQQTRRRRGTITPLNNRVLVRWEVDQNFCDDHQLTLFYQYSMFSPYSYIDLDSTETCMEQFVYIYTTTSSIFVTPQVRTNTTQIDLPTESCVIVNLETDMRFSIPTGNLIDRPVISDVFESQTTSLTVNWLSYSPSNFEIDYYNVYVFPIHALRFDGGSCSNLNANTQASDFTFLPTEYYRYGVGVPSGNVSFTCPPPIGLSLPYTCTSVQSDTTSVSVSIDRSYAVSLIVEAVIRNSQDTIRSVISYPYNYTAMVVNIRDIPGYLEFSWNTELCQSQSSFIFSHRFTFDFISQTSAEKDFVFSCQLGKGFDYQVPIIDGSLTSYSNYLSAVTTTDGEYCLLSYESPSYDPFFPFPEGPFVDLFDSEYVNYETITITLQITEIFQYPVNVYAIPTIYRGIQSIPINDFCPSPTDLSEIFLRQRFNSTLSDTSSLVCENNTKYTCTPVYSLIDITISYIPGYAFDIRVESPNFQNTFNAFGPLYAPYSESSAFEPQGSSNALLIAPNVIMVEWNVDFYCPPNSYIYLQWDSFNISPMRKRGLPTLVPQAVLPCSAGYYAISDLGFDSSYSMTGYVFFNSTHGSFPDLNCPLTIITFPGFIRTAPLLIDLRIVDFSNIELTWNAIPGINQPYNLLALPSSYGTFDQPITGSISPNTLTQSIITLISQNTEISEIFQLFEMCLNSSEPITCSKVSTTDTSAILPVIPGYSYILYMYVVSGGQTGYLPLGNGYDLRTALQSQVSVSAFDTQYTYSFNTSICTLGVSTVFYYTASTSSYPVTVCPVDTRLFFSGTLFNTLPQPEVIFTFPFTNITFPGFNITSPPAFGITVNPQLSFLPFAASPMILDVTSPLEVTSDIFLVSWTTPPDLPIFQELETFTVFAYAESQLFSFGDVACPTFLEIFPEEFTFDISITKGTDPLTNSCPSQSIHNVYACGEFPPAPSSAQLSVLTLLDYDFTVTAMYSGGLNTNAFSFLSNSIQATQSLYNLSMTYTVTPASIIIIWDSQVSFCSDSRFFFVLNSTFIPNYVPCTSGSFTIDSLQPLTTYYLTFIFFFDPSTIFQTTIPFCIANLSPEFDFSPMTTSFCTPVNPCGVEGICSEGFQNSSYHCDCSTGFLFDGNTCVDINECITLPDVCINAACLNTAGSYTCTCFEGYKIVSATVCEDINECETPNNCVNGNCTNFLSPENYRCDCEAGFEGSSCTIPIETPTCPSISESTTLSINNVTFPVTEYGVVAVVSCSQLDTELFGNITRQCLDTGEWGSINLNDCQRLIFVALEQITSMSEIQILTPVESASLSEDLVTATQVTGSLFPGEVSVAATGVGAIADSLFNLTGQELIDSLNLVQSNVVRITSNVLSATNEPAFEAATPSEAQNYVSDLVDGIQDIGILIGSVAEENTTIVLEISEPTVALIVTVQRNRAEPLVLGSNLTMAVGNNASAVMAAQASVTIPAALFPPEEAIAVSVALFSYVQDLLGSVFLNESVMSENNQVDILTSSIVSVNLFTRAGEPINVLAEPITLRFVVNESDIPDDPESQVELRCASARQLSDGWDFLYVSLTNRNEVPDEPANCAASHLTHFGVLVSVTSNNFSPPELLALEILTYLTSGLSILFLLLSIIGYAILWWKTRKHKEGLFQKDATILHLNFAVSLLLALIFFLVAVPAYGHEAVCKAFTVFQYYFWLSVFTSSLSIGIYLLIKIFAWSSQRRFWFYLVLLSWTLPLPLIIITPSIARNDLINTKDMACWFTKEPTYMNLGFIVPMIVITLTNIVILIITAVVLFRVSKGTQGIFRQVRGVLAASFILAPILALPWLFSVITAIPTSALTFLFVIILGLQGVVFAILYPLRTPEMIDYVIRCRSSKSASMMSQSSSSHPTRNTPTAIKFRVNRRDQGTSGTASTSVGKQDDGVELGDIRPEAPSIKKKDTGDVTRGGFDNSATISLLKDKESL